MDLNNKNSKERNDTSQNFKSLAIKGTNNKKLESFKLDKFDIEILSNDSIDQLKNKVDFNKNLNVDGKSTPFKSNNLRRIFSFNDNGVPAKKHLYNFKLNLVEYYDYVYKNYSKYFWYKRCVELQKELNCSKLQNTSSTNSLLNDNLILAQKNYHSFNKSKNSSNNNINNVSNNYKINSSFNLNSNINSRLNSSNICTYDSFHNYKSISSTLYSNKLNKNSSPSLRKKIKLIDGVEEFTNLGIFTNSNSNLTEKRTLGGFHSKDVIVQKNIIKENPIKHNFPTNEFGVKLKSNSNINVNNSTIDYFNERHKNTGTFKTSQIQSKSFTFTKRNLNLGHDYSNKFSKNN